MSAHLYDKSKELHQAMSSVTRDSIACGVAACNGDLRRSVLEFEVWITTGQKKVSVTVMCCILSSCFLNRCSLALRSRQKNLSQTTGTRDRVVYFSPQS